MKKGKYIVFEGIDGSGKTYQSKRLVKSLERLGESVFWTKEPTDGPVGKLTRQFLSKQIEIDTRVIGAMFVPDTLHHFVKPNGIVERVKRGEIVISDRSYFSTFAYQSVVLDMEWLMKAHSISMDILLPDMVVYIDLPAEIGYQRILDRGEQLMIHEELSFLKGLEERYKKAFSMFSGKVDIVSIDGDRTKDEIELDVFCSVRRTCFF